jgi:hypothetical protein
MDIRSKSDSITQPRLISSDKAKTREKQQRNRIEVRKRNERLETEAGEYNNDNKQVIDALQV